MLPDMSTRFGATAYLPTTEDRTDAWRRCADDPAMLLHLIACRWGRRSSWSSTAPGSCISALDATSVNEANVSPDAWSANSKLPPRKAVEVRTQVVRWRGAELV